MKSNTASGGIAVFERGNYPDLFSVVDMGNEDIIWVKIKKELCGEDRDIFVGTCYFNPSVATENPEKISRLINDISLLQKKGHVLIIGEFNATTCNQDDTIPPNKFDSEFYINQSKPPPKRNSQDKILNNRGKELIEMCKSLEFYIVNGRKLGDPFGNYTCFQWNGNSVNDYLLTSESIFDQVSTFKVGDFLPRISDHCPLIFTLEIPNLEKTLDTKPFVKEAPRQYLWNKSDSDKFLDALKLPENDEKLNAILNLDYTKPNEVVDQITEVLIATADKAKLKKKSHCKNISSQQPPWFDTMCVKLKKGIKKGGYNVKMDPKNQCLKDELYKLKRLLKKTVRKNKLLYKEKIIQSMNLSRKRGKQFWKMLGKLEQKGNDEIFKQSISDEKWILHFKSVLQSKNLNNSGGEIPSNTAEEGVLDYKISDEELKLATYILKKGKAAGLDCIPNEMITCLLSTKPEIIKKLFNSILLKPTIINKWHVAMIFPIHKKGSKTNPNNYRGISLLSCLGKFFSAILNSRLFKFAKERNILSKSQLGFIQGNRTSDALLILHNLIDFYYKKRKTYLFACFVDFQKAFDSIPRYILFQKLLDHNINGKFYDCLTSL